MLPYEGERRLPYARTPWGIRVPVRALTPGETRTIRLVPPDSAAGEAEPDAG
jgi:hypothetical protein